MMINSLSSLATLDLENIGGVNSSNNFNLPETDMVTMPGGSSVNSLPGPDLTPRQYPG